MPLNYHCIGNLNLLLLKNEAHATKFEKWDPPMVNRALVSNSFETFEIFVTIFSGPTYKRFKLINFFSHQLNGRPNLC